MRKGVKIKQFEKVLYCSAEWIFIEEIGSKYLLRSVNKNIDDILADREYVKKIKEKVKPETDAK